MNHDDRTFALENQVWLNDYCADKDTFSSVSFSPLPNQYYEDIYYEQNVYYSVDNRWTFANNNSVKIV